MTKAIDLNHPFVDTEPPFGHPGRNYDDTPSHFDAFEDR